MGACGGDEVMVVISACVGWPGVPPWVAVAEG